MAKKTLDEKIDDALDEAKEHQTKKVPQLQPESVKQKIIRIHPMALLGLFQEGNAIGIKKGVQAGTQYVGGGYDAATNTFFIHTANKRYDEVPIGERIPTLDIELQDLTGVGDDKEK